MSNQVAHILELAANLDRHSQWQLIQQLTFLMQSQEEMALPEEWKTELSRRIDALDRGEEVSRPWREVIAIANTSRKPRQWDGEA